MLESSVLVSRRTSNVNFSDPRMFAELHVEGNIGELILVISVYFGLDFRQEIAVVREKFLQCRLCGPHLVLLIRALVLNTHYLQQARIPECLSRTWKSDHSDVVGWFQNKRDFQPFGIRSYFEINFAEGLSVL